MRKKQCLYHNGHSNLYRRSCRPSDHYSHVRNRPDAYGKGILDLQLALKGPCESPSSLTFTVTEPPFRRCLPICNKPRLIWFFMVAIWRRAALILLKSSI